MHSVVGLATMAAFFKNNTIYFMSQTIAFVGVGRMGANMARRLKDCGYTISAVYDAHRPSATSLAEELGCAAPETLAEVTASAGVIFTVVTNDASMRGIFLGAGDSLLKGAQGKIFINCATLSPGIHREVHAAAEAAGAIAAAPITQSAAATSGVVILIILIIKPICCWAATPSGSTLPPALPGRRRALNRVLASSYGSEGPNEPLGLGP